MAQIRVSVRMVRRLLHWATLMKETGRGVDKLGSLYKTGSHASESAQPLSGRPRFPVFSGNSAFPDNGQLRQKLSGGGSECGGCGQWVTPQPL